MTERQALGAIIGALLGAIISGLIGCASEPMAPEIEVDPLPCAPGAPCDPAAPWRAEALRDFGPAIFFDWHDDCQCRE